MIGAFSAFKIGAGVLAMLAFAALVWSAQDRFAQKAKADDARACNAAAASTTKPIDTCLPALRLAIESQRRSEACDHALAAPDLVKSRAAIQLVCSAPVKREFLARELAQGEVTQANETIAALIDSRDTAVVRAEERGQSANTKAQRNAQIIARASRDAGSLIRCDASCLRDLAD